MTEFEEVIRATRAAYEPSLADRERNRRRLRAGAIGAGVATSLAAKSTLASSGWGATLAGQSLGTLAKLFFGSMALTMVGVTAGVAVTRLGSSPQSAPSAPHAVPTDLPSPARTHDVALNPLPEPPESATAIPAEPPTLPERRGSAAPAAPASAPPPRGDELNAELALLREARRASESGDFARAKRLLDGLDERFPQGVLMEERAALRAVAACQTSSERRNEIGQQFLGRYPASVYAAKVRRVCSAAPAPTPTSAATADFMDAPGRGH